MSAEMCRHGRQIRLHPCERCEEREVMRRELLELLKVIEPRYSNGGLEQMLQFHHQCEEAVEALTRGLS